MIFAYVDPGLGLLAWQAVVAAFVGSIFYVRKTRNWIVRLVQKLFRSQQQQDKVVAKASSIPK